MQHRIPGEPGPQDFRETAERSRDANIADESAGYVNASPRISEEPDRAAERVQVPEGLAGADKPVDMAPDESDSIEPHHIPGSARDIHVAGETGPGPSG